MRFFISGSFRATDGDLDDCCSPFVVTRRTPVRFRVSACAALAAAGARDASAQTPSPLGEWQYSAGVPLRKLYEPNISTWDISMGAAMTLQPRYAGPDRYRVMGGPTIDIRIATCSSCRPAKAGANARGPNWRVSLSVGYDPAPLGRRPPAPERPRQHQRGAGDETGGRLRDLEGVSLVLRADIRRSIGGSNGWVGDFSAYMPMPGSNEHFFWFAGPTVVRRFALHEQLVRREQRRRALGAAGLFVRPPSRSARA